MILEKRLDTIHIVAQRKRNGVVDLGKDGKIITKCDLMFKIVNQLNLVSTSTYKEDIVKTEDSKLFFLIKEDRLEIQVKGSFFVLTSDWEKKLNLIIKILIDENIKYHITRVDFLYLIKKDLFKTLEQSDFKKIHTSLRKVEKKPYWFNAFNSVLGVVYYDKLKQLKKIKKANPEYYSYYKNKYNLKEPLEKHTEPLYHLELRFFELIKKNPKTKIITDRIPAARTYPLNIYKMEKEILKEISKRIKFKKAIREIVMPVKRRVK